MALALVQWLVIILLAILVLGLLRRTTSVLEAAERQLSRPDLNVRGLQRGATVPAFVASSATGEPLPSSVLLEHAGVVLFLSSACAPCRRLAEELSRLEKPPAELPITVIVDQGWVRAGIPQIRGVTLAIQANHTVSDAFDSNATPHAFLVDAGGVVVDAIIPAEVKDLMDLAQMLESHGVYGKNPALAPTYIESTMSEPLVREGA
jgi:thiol-disulfide isomerase/thioredoxin